MRETTGVRFINWLSFLSCFTTAQHLTSEECLHKPQLLRISFYEP